jgi:hypothetical protein
MAPVLTLHPEKRGQPVSGRDRGILNASGAGFLLNVRAEGDELRGDVFIDAARAEAIADLKVILAKLEKGEPTELSTGFPVSIEETKGAHNGRDYDRIIRPAGFDHLAIFATATGACSIKDGCGLGVNHSGDCTVAEYAGAGAMDDPQPGWLKQITDHVSALLRKHTDNAVPTPEAGDPKEDESMNRDQMIASLVANGLCKDDLAKLSDDSIKAMHAAANKSAPAATTTSDDPEEVAILQRRIVELRQQKESLEAETRTALLAEKEERMRLVEELIFNGNTQYSDDDIRAMKIGEIRKLHGTVFRRQDFTARGGPRTGTASLSWTPQSIFAAPKEAN